MSLEDKAYFWFAVVIVVPIIIVFIYSDPCRDRGCYLNENVLFEEEFKGTVKEKFINKGWGARNAKTLIINNDISVQMISGDYYQRIEVGDSIHKARESYVLTVVKSDSIEKLEYKYDCNE